MRFFQMKRKLRSLFKLIFATYSYCDIYQTVKGTNCQFVRYIYFMDKDNLA